MNTSDCVSRALADPSDTGHLDRLFVLAGRELARFTPTLHELAAGQYPLDRLYERAAFNFAPLGLVIAVLDEAEATHADVERIVERVRGAAFHPFELAILVDRLASVPAFGSVASLASGALTHVNCKSKSTHIRCTTRHSFLIDDDDRVTFDDATGSFSRGVLRFRKPNIDRSCTLLATTIRRDGRVEEGDETVFHFAEGDDVRILVTFPRANDAVRVDLFFYG
jgi:hypothetical protein